MTRAIQAAHTANKRSLDKLAARLFYYSARLHEHVNTYESIRLYIASPADGDRRCPEPH